MYKHLDISYNKTHLLELYSHSKKRVPNKHFIEATDILEDPEVSRLLELFPFVPKVDASLSLGLFRRDVRPYINDGNNGLIVLPVFGSVEFKFYNYQAPIVDGRPRLSPMAGAIPEEQIAEISKDISEFFVTDKPVMINGLVPHSYHVYNNQNPVMLIFKIPMEIPWEVASSNLS